MSRGNKFDRVELILAFLGFAAHEMARSFLTVMLKICADKICRVSSTIFG